MEKGSNGAKKVRAARGTDSHASDTVTDVGMTALRAVRVDVGIRPYDAE